SFHACALRATGTVSCWGKNTVGQLGSGTQGSVYRARSVPGVANATAITAGNRFTCALIADGTITCWGDNYYGQLGNGAALFNEAPVPPTRVHRITGRVQEHAAGSH